ncbi:Uu.00g075540.m01.CDS01 [Anthostomella pinea]|uniref:Uu.00g075540.m01.CDS01 n=1 Tax=Anthostomella pinea TaxID=933095 RepID=A0AAI8YP13_9PEZI|nr:Uu.00g075540.m01.CDS01 [Anthostomella pinea]
MDSKAPAGELELPPPPYTVRDDDATSYNVLQPVSLTSQLQHHRMSLPDRIRATQEAHTTQQSFDDLALLDHLVPGIETFLADLGRRHTAPSLATLTLVPEAAVPRDAVLSGFEEMRQRGEVCEVSRVAVYPNLTDGKDSKKRSSNAHGQASSGDQHWASGKEFSDWGRFGELSTATEDSTSNDGMFWWRDEDLAHRLASYMQPKIEKRVSTKHMSVVQNVVEQRLPAQKDKKGWAWGRRVSGSGKRGEDVLPAVKPVASEDQQQAPDRVQMSVIADKVAFRRENDFGIWESLGGWAIVVAVRVRT